MATNTYVALQTVTLGSNTQYVEFTSIPQTYTDLVIVCNARDSGGGTVNTQMQVGNGSYDTAGNYSWTWLGGSGSSAASGRASSTSSIYWGAIGTTSFSPAIINIQNYTNTSTHKTVLARNSLADQSSGQSVSAWVGLWRSTSAINQLRLFPGGQTFATGSTFTIYGIAAASVGAKATGGTIYSDSQYIYHAFTSSGTFTPTQSISADVLVVAGGGGGSNAGGGGGAGGALGLTSQSLTATGYTVTIGGGANGSTGGAYATKGTDSSFAGLGTAVGGGPGGRAGTGANNQTAKTGGSGGGSGGGNTDSQYPGLGTSGQGNAGGQGVSTVPPGSAGGGGGAGGVGTNGSGNNGGAGGLGTSAYSTWFDSTGSGVSGKIAAGGGGGGGQPGSGNSLGGTAEAGAGAGGYGTANPTAQNGFSASANTGGGGGGGGIAPTTDGNGGNGGSGLVIVRYAR